MDIIGQMLADWRNSLPTNIPVASLYSRNRVAHKYKAPFRCLMLREATFWRITDLLNQSYALHQQGHGLGARILLRSGFETLAAMIYMNQIIQQVLEGRMEFQQFDEKTRILLLGSRDQSTRYKSLNIITILGKCDTVYPGIAELYGTLSESAHPNYEGMVAGYSRVNRDGCEVNFSNQWSKLYGASHLCSMELCMATFDDEYNKVWPCLIEKLEDWIAENDEKLGASRSATLGAG